MSRVIITYDLAELKRSEIVAGLDELYRTYLKIKMVYHNA